MMTDIIYIFIIVALFVLYCFKFREKNLQFTLGVAWFSLEVLRIVATAIFFGTLVYLKESSLDLYQWINFVTLSINFIKLFECVILFCIVLCYFLNRRKLHKNKTKINFN